MKNYTEVFSLKGKTVFIVGGLGLLGEASAKAAAGSRAKTVVLDINAPKAKLLLAWAKKKKYRLFYEHFDCTDLDGCENVLRTLFKKYGPAHVLVNASYPRSSDWGLHPDQVTVRYLRENVDKHLNSYLWISRVAGFLMKEAEIKGSLINFGSTYGVVAQDLTIYEGTPMDGEITYSAIKGGIINLSRFLASYFGKYGIRSNCVCPGGIFDRQNPEFVKKYERKTFLKRMGSPEDIASAVVFLSSDASSYVTGATLMVDGGWTAA